MKLTELRQKSAAELSALLDSKKQEIVELNLAISTQKSKQTHQKAILRKDLAQIATRLTEQNLQNKEAK